jgi:mannose-6-phosphate isomerase-like protein (cupin superfamily)
MLSIRRTGLTALALVVAVAVGWHAKTIAQENSSIGVATVYAHEKLDASWANAASKRGSNLFWSRTSSKGTYDVNTNTRESVKNACAPAGCQHKDFTAFVYVVSGAADLLIGGTGKATAPDKFGGQLIQGGQSHRISKGDVFVMPPETIHWYKNVETPFRYLEVPIP